MSFASFYAAMFTKLGVSQHEVDTLRLRMHQAVKKAEGEVVGVLSEIHEVATREISQLNMRAQSKIGQGAVNPNVGNGTSFPAPHTPGCAATIALLTQYLDEGFIPLELTRGMQMMSPLAALIQTGTTAGRMVLGCTLACVASMSNPKLEWDVIKTVITGRMKLSEPDADTAKISTTTAGAIFDLLKEDLEFRQSFLAEAAAFGEDVLQLARGMFQADAKASHETLEDVDTAVSDREPSVAPPSILNASAAASTTMTAAKMAVPDGHPSLKNTTAEDVSKKLMASAVSKIADNQ